MTTLAELKAENAVETEEVAPETEVVIEAAEEVTGDGIDNDEETGETPFWMEEKEETVESAPVSALVKLKRKLKGKIEDRDDEIAQLKAQLEELKRPPQTASSVIQPPKRPRNLDFNTDEEYEEAMDRYEEAKLIYQTNFIGQNQDQIKRVQQRNQTVEQNVEKHYERAAKLVESTGIKPEIYQHADAAVKQVINAVQPGKGELIFNELVDMVGEGSEKTFFYIGRNKQAQNEFLSLLTEDPTGLKASIYLGRITERISGAKNQSSRAPAPSAQLRGDDASNSKGSALKRKYEQAQSRNNPQEAYNLKKQAKKQGLDTSKW
ncbi:MAG: hypothetical protein HGA87_01195 [Desulfobulbaceae bacterium]|nr:hypothetical protein [Desulfobulbaceae bacterium]